MIAAHRGRAVLALGLSASGPYMGRCRRRICAHPNGRDHFGVGKELRVRTREAYRVRMVRAAGYALSRNLRLEARRRYNASGDDAAAEAFTVKNVVFQRADFATWNYSISAQNIFNLNGDPDIDAYVLILRDWHNDEIGYSVQSCTASGSIGATRERQRRRHLRELSHRRDRREHRRDLRFARSRHARRTLPWLQRCLSGPKRRTI